MLMRLLEPDMGVWMSVGELVDPEDEDETEAERLRGLMVIGAERFGGLLWEPVLVMILFWEDIARE